MIIKAIAIFLLLAIVVSLGSGLIFLIKDKGESRRTLNALKLRIALSILAFIVILIGFFTGMVPMNSFY